MASTYLSRTPASSGSSSVLTYSFWTKRSGLGVLSPFLSGGNSGTVGQIVFSASDQLNIYNGASVIATTNAKFRDTSAWYHIVISLNSSETGTDKCKIWINGVQETSFATDNRSTFTTISQVNQSGIVQYVGSDTTGYVNGLMSHIHMVDGTAYDASAFGETDATTGIWKPKLSPSVTYGTNGFFLKFNEGALGTDSSPNGNNFTVNGSLTPTKDTPENVFATLNSEYSNVAGLTFSNGNNTITNSGAWKSSISTLGMQKGKWYCEVKLISGTNHSLGVIEYSGSSSDSYYNGANIDNQGLIGGYGKNWGWYVWTGSFRYGANVELTTGNTLGVGDIAQIALDYDNGKIWFGKNGTWENSGDPANGTNPIFSGITFTDATFFAFGPENASDSVNFGNGYFGTTPVSSATSDESGLGIFEHTVPNGYNCLCTKNINTYG